ncbi:MAG: S1 RNA-binding domain-containing protein [Clostridiales bacterium]|jgi:small subunit ribosomal protein S1|nr:S1 RNA-binding domain-containing protein [Clostridiales bacterium]
MDHYENTEHQGNEFGENQDFPGAEPGIDENREQNATFDSAESVNPDYEAPQDTVEHEEKDGDPGESSQPRRKRKKKDEQPAEAAEDNAHSENPDYNGVSEDNGATFDTLESDFVEGREPQGLPDDENTGTDEQAGDLPENTGERVSAEGPSAAMDEGTPTVGSRTQTTRRRRSSRQTVLDASGNVITQRGDTGQHDLSALTAARNARRILTSTVDGIETDGEALPRVIFYHGTVKVMIPFSEMGFDLDPEQVSQREARLLIDSMLGAKIDYMVRGVDTDARIAGASRRDAMLMRQRTILNARGTRDEFRITEGMRVMARVVHVARQVIRVEVYGFECYVWIDSISNLWVNDIREVIQVGEERPVEIVTLRRDEAGRVTAMQVSMKAAEDTPNLELRDGNTYTGTISNFSDTAYFVRVNGIPVEVRCPIKSNHAMEMMNQGDYVKFYIRGIYEGVPTGAILKIIKKKIQPQF